jgi:hypothetical protein
MREMEIKDLKDLHLRLSSLIYESWDKMESIPNKQHALFTEAKGANDAYHKVYDLVTELLVKEESDNKS